MLLKFHVALLFGNGICLPAIKIDFYYRKHKCIVLV